MLLGLSVGSTETSGVAKETSSVAPEAEERSVSAGL